MGVVPHLKVNMGSRGSTCASHKGNFLSLLDLISFFNKEFRVVSVKGG